MKKNNLYIILLALILSVGFLACKGNASTVETTPSPSTVVFATPTPEPTPSPTPTPVKFAADIVDIPDEDTVADMEIDEIEDTPFFIEVTNTDDVVMAEFWSENATYCAETSQVLVELSENTGVKVVRVNVDANPTLANDFGIIALPSVYVFLGGVQVDAVLGAAPLDIYEAMILKYRQ